MNILKLLKKNSFLQSAIFIILTLFGVFYAYQYVFQTYFAMDEWSFWAEFLKYGPFHKVQVAGLIGSLTGALRSGLYVTNDIYFYLFGLDIRPWQITTIAFHLGNIFLLFKLLRKFNLSPFSSFLGSFYFAIASAGQEALSWPATQIVSPGTTFFILFALLLTIKFTESKRKMFIVIAIISTYIGFLLRPTAIVTPVLMAYLIFMYSKKPSLMRLPRIVIAIGIIAFFIGLFRVIMQYSNQMSILLKGGFDIIFYPVVSLSHIFIPYRLMFRLSDGFINFYYPIISKDKNVDSISHLIVGDFISIVVSIFLLVLIYYLYKKVDKFNKKVIIFGLITFSIQYIPIALTYIDRGGLSYIESRHMYTSIIGVSVILGVFFNYVIAKYGKAKGLKKYLFFAFFLLIGFLFYKEMLVTRREVRAQAIDGTAIKKTWDSLNTVKLPESNKVVIYLTSDRSYYYPDYHLPFKLRAVFMLPLSFYGRQFIDKCSLGVLQYDNSFINCNNKQFGYFTDINKLIPLVKSGQIKIEDVVGLHFVDGSYTFKDTTRQTRALIE